MAFPTIRQLQIFATVARMGNFTKAAEALFLSQPAVSIQVKQLEHSIGLPLYEMVGKNLALTAAGEEVYRCSQQLQQTLEEMVATINALKGLTGGELKIAVATTASYFAIEMLAEFSRLYPEVTIALDVTNRKALISQLQYNQCDLVLMGEPPVDMPLVSVAIMVNPLVVVASPAHPFAGQAHIPLAALGQQAFVVRERGSGTRAAIERFFQQQQIPFNTRMAMTSNEAIKHAVMANVGIGIASLHTLDLELETGKLVLLPVELFPIHRHWYIVHSDGKRLSPAAERFKRFVLETAKYYKTASPNASAPE